MPHANVNTLCTARCIFLQKYYMCYASSSGELHHTLRRSCNYQIFVVQPKGGKSAMWKPHIYVYAKRCICKRKTLVVSEYLFKSFLRHFGNSNLNFPLASQCKLLLADKTACGDIMFVIDFLYDVERFSKFSHVLERNIKNIPLPFLWLHGLHNSTV